MKLKALAIVAVMLTAPSAHAVDLTTIDCRDLANYTLRVARERATVSHNVAVNELNNRAIDLRSPKAERDVFRSALDLVYRRLDATPEQLRDFVHGRCIRS